MAGGELGTAWIVFGVKAEGQALESIARPLTAQDSDGQPSAAASA